MVLVDFTPIKFMRIVNLFGLKPEIKNYKAKHVKKP